MSRGNRWITTDDEGESENVPPGFVQPADIFVMIFGLLGDLAMSFAEFFKACMGLAKGHSNAAADHEDFGVEAALGIESITRGELP